MKDDSSRDQNRPQAKKAAETSQPNKTTVYIEGMHCGACELRLESALSSLQAVQKVQASSRKGTVELHHKSPKLSMKTIASIVEEAGYRLGEKPNKPLLSRNPQDYKHLAFGAVILAVLYFIVTKAGLTNLSVGQSNSSSSLFVPLLIGLTAGVSTCMAMVGGLTLGVSASFAKKHPQASSLQKFRPHLLFNLGRVISFTLLGGVIGYIGSFLRFSGTGMGLLTLVVAVVMLLMGVQLVDISPRLNGVSLTLPSSIGKALGLGEKKDRNYSVSKAMILGGLTFFLPCGFTQAMQVLSVTSGSFVTGALTMGLFAIGTLPGLLGVGGITSIARGGFAKPLYRFVGMAVILLAVFNASNALTLTGLRAPIQPDAAQVAAASAPIESAANTSDPAGDQIQVVHMVQGSDGYSPRYITVVWGKPVKWIIDSQDQGSCSSSLYSQQLGIDQSLKPGENVFEFTPMKLGLIGFSCSMGMYGGMFEVVGAWHSPS